MFIKIPVIRLRIYKDLTIQLKFDYYFFTKIKYGNDDVEKIKANSNCTDKSKQITLRPS